MAAEKENKLRLIMGLQGSGKTQRFIQMVKDALAEEKGLVVCIERGKRLTYDIPHEARLVESTDYGFVGYDYLKGFIAGLYAGNFDITHIFIDSVLRMIDQPFDDKAESFFLWCEEFGQLHDVKFTMMVSKDVASAGDTIKGFLA